MRRPVGELGIGLDELIEWMAFEQVSPWPDEKNEFMLAELITIVVSAFSKKTPKITDFMLSEIIGKAEKEACASDDQIRSVFKVIEAHGKG